MLDSSQLSLNTSLCSSFVHPSTCRVQQGRYIPFWKASRLLLLPGSDAKIAREGFLASLPTFHMAHFVQGSPGRPRALPTFVASPPTPAPVSSSVSSRPRPPTSCSESTSGSNCVLTLYEGRITGCGGAKQFFRCTAAASLPLPHRTSPRLRSSSSSSSSSSKFDPARLDCLRRHEALRQKRDENVQVIRAREGLLYFK